MTLILLWIPRDHRAARARGWVTCPASEYLKRIVRAEMELERAGFSALRVVASVREIERACAAMDLNPDSPAARAAAVAAVAERRAG